jgi:hypothetical protein
VDINRMGLTTNDQIAASGQNQVAKTLDIYDSEMLKIEEVLQAIQNRRGSRQRQDLGDFDLFIREAFHKIGFIADVKWYDTNIPDVKAPDIEIVGRVDENFVFDRDRQVHEVTNDLLGLGEGGVIKTTNEDMKNLMKQAEAHGHGHSH